MEPERWRQMDELLERVLDMPPEARATWLDAGCGADEALCSGVKELLDALASAGSFLALSALQVAAKEMAAEEGQSLVGRQLGHYEVLAPLGTGGTGEVYLARDNRLDRKVAIKRLLPSLTHDPNQLQRFEMEARAASALNHPNVVTVFDVGTVDDSSFIVTEFVDAQTLRHRLHGPSLTTREAIDIALQVASALAAAHGAGVVHRDIKPENIALRKDGLVKVLDFGLAKLIDTQGSGGDRASSGPVRGTPHYMSPEQARGAHVDARSDIFSLGVVLYEMITGSRPFDGDTASHVIVAILERAPTPLGERVRSAPFSIERVVDKALAKNPDERYGRIEELQADLIDVLRELDGGPGGKQSGSCATPAVRSATIPRGSDRPTNLAVLPALIGREREIAEGARLLQREDVRLVTLTGVGGTGKTRLAQAVAHQLLPAFADGVYFIELAAITDPELVALAIAQPLGVKEEGGRCLTECLRDHLRGLRMLLVLDNFEQLLSAAPLVADLLACSRRLKILVTSRARLHLSLEQEFTVPSLALAPGGVQLSAGEVLRYAAIRLFVDRAHAVRPGFAVTDDSALAVAEVCARLDGLPLAIELAAARVRLLQPRAILSRLEHRLKLLTGGARDLPRRQQTMRATVEWSYDLLDPHEKVLFRRLAVFAGGFTLEAAETVCRRATDGPRVEVLDAVASLVDKSLLVQTERPDGELRFRLLEVVKEYALEALEPTSEANPVRQSHASYFLALAEEAEPQLLERASVQWLERLEEEHDNLRTALRWSTAHDADTAVRLAGALQYFWLFHGYLTEGRKWLAAALDRSAEAAAGPRSKVEFGAGQLARLQGDYHAAYRCYQQSVASSRVAGDRRQVALSSEGLGSVVAHLHGDFGAARALFTEALSIGRELEDDRVVATSLNSLAELERAEGNLAAARPLYEEALARHRQKGDKEGQSICLCNLGAVAYCEGDLQAARSRYAEALAAALELGNRIDISISLDGFAAVTAERGDVEQAVQLAGAADGLRESMGYELETAADRLFRNACVTRLRASVSESVFASEYEKGRALKMSAAAALALPPATHVSSRHAPPPPHDCDRSLTS